MILVMGHSLWHFYGKKNVNTIIEDVGVLLNLHILKSLNSIERIQPRMMYASFNGKPCTTIISLQSYKFQSPTTCYFTWSNIPKQHSNNWRHE